MSGNETSPEAPWYAKPWFVLAGIFLAVAIIGSLVVVFVIPSTPNNAAPDTSTKTPTATDTSAPLADPADSVCDLPAGNQDKPTTAPTTSWRTVGTATIPFAPTTFGPGELVADEVPTCFAHSPTGALYAATSIGGLAAARNFTAIYEHLSAPGPGLDKLLAAPATSEPTTASGQTYGYQFLSYTGDVAVITVAFLVSNGAYVSWPMTLQWIDGDWKLQIPENGNAAFSQLENVDGFVGWSGS